MQFTADDTAGFFDVMFEADGHACAGSAWMPVQRIQAEPGTCMSISLKHLVKEDGGVIGGELHQTTPSMQEQPPSTCGSCSVVARTHYSRSLKASFPSSRRKPTFRVT